jgi:hypothetical protein
MPLNHFAHVGPEARPVSSPRELPPQTIRLFSRLGAQCTSVFLTDVRCLPSRAPDTFLTSFYVDSSLAHLTFPYPTYTWRGGE